MTTDDLASRDRDGKKPWMKFFKGDWRADASLRMCSPGARLLWLEMLLLMDDADPRGHLLVKGRPPTIRQLGMLSGITESDTVEWLSELRDAEVFSENDDGVIFSRKMVRDDKRSKEQAARVAKRWSGMQSGNTGCDTETIPQIPDTRVQTLDETSSSNVVASPKRKRAARRCPSDWMPSERDNETLRAEGIGEFNRPSALARFKDHEFTRAKSDWSATYRNWIRKDAEDAKRSRPASGHDQRKQAAVEVLEERRNLRGEGQVGGADDRRFAGSAGNALVHYERQPTR